jgi:hypothetical protein
MNNYVIVLKADNKDLQDMIDFMNKKSLYFTIQTDYDFENKLTEALKNNFYNKKAPTS